MWRLFVLLVILMVVSYSTASENNGTFGENVDGNGLIKLGRELNKPMLTLIGMAIHNLQPCGEWAPWSPCDSARRGYFGSQTRTRSCADTGHMDPKILTAELDKKLCEGFCPVSYNLTSNGFCMKLNTTKVSHDEAMEQCKLEGGYLIHIDSQTKHDDVKSVIGDSQADFHINGRRKDSSSSWKYQYGSKSAFLTWYPGYPNRELCLAYDTSHRQYDNTCSTSYPFLCEILI